MLPKFVNVDAELARRSAALECLRKTSCARLRSILLKIGRNTAPRSAYSPPVVAKIFVLLDVRLERLRLLLGSERVLVVQVGGAQVNVTKFISETSRGM